MFHYLRRELRNKLMRVVQEALEHERQEQRKQMDQAVERVLTAVRNVEVRDRRDIFAASERDAVATSARFAREYMPTASTFRHPHETLRHGLSLAPSTGMAFEFGVYTGTTLQIIAEARGGHDVYGFDSFAGLPESWRSGFPAGAFGVDTVPELPGAELVAGWFDKTLPGFLADHPGQVAFLHVDADLYSSAVTVLEHVGPRLVPGSVVVFDEYFNFPGWQDHEHRAWSEYCRDTGTSFRFEATRATTSRSPSASSGIPDPSLLRRVGGCRVVVLTVLAGAAACAWAYLLAGHGGFWRTDQRLPRVPADPEYWPGVVAVVPARDEADVLPETLPGLLDQDYPGELRVVLVDDGSTDGTADLAHRLARGAPRELTVVSGSEPPDGWAGKVWAMAQGAMTAGAAAGDTHDPDNHADAGGPAAPPYLLFTDADIACDRGTVAALVRAAVGDDRDLVSQMALLRAETGWERAVVPAFVYFFALLYPFRRVNRPGARTAAAAGGCMLVRRRALDAAGGLARIKGARIDDVALGRLLKRRPGGGRIWLGFTTAVVSHRAYPGLAALWDMVTRSAYTQLRYSPVLLAGTVTALVTLYAAPPVAAIVGLTRLAAGDGGAAGGGPAGRAGGFGAAGWVLMSATYVPALRLYGLSPWRAPSLPLVAVLYAAMTVDSARRHRLGRGGIWKGRTEGPRQDAGPWRVSMAGWMLCRWRRPGCPGSGSATTS